MTVAHYAVPVSERADVARALLAAADDPDHQVRTSDRGFYVPEDVWDKAFPPITEPEPPKKAAPAKATRK